MTRRDQGSSPSSDKPGVARSCNRGHISLYPLTYRGKKRKSQTSTYKMHLPDFSLTTNHLIRAGWDLFQWSSSHDFMTGYTIFINTLTFRHNKGLQPAATNFELWVEPPKSTGRTYKVRKDSIKCTVLIKCKYNHSCLNVVVLFFTHSNTDYLL